MTEKEKAVYEAVGRMCENGTDISAVKVADIAKEAGIGKGTVYEYFQTKEEIIGKALVYNMQKQEDMLWRSVEKVSSFSEKLDTAMDWVEDNSRIRYWMVHFLTANQKDNNIGEWIRSRQKCIEEEANRYMEIVDQILQKGQEEGILKTPANRLVRDTAVMAASSAILMYLQYPERYNCSTLQQVKTYSRDILISIINMAE